MERGVNICLLGFIHQMPVLEPDADIFDIDALTYEKNIVINLKKID